jgi:hypothetical protein
VLIPVPVVAIPPGLLVKVHVPDDGKSVNSTLPVASLHVGWVIESMVGAAGAPGATLTVNAVAVEVQPLTVVVTSYSPAASPEKIPVVLF